MQFDRRSDRSGERSHFEALCDFDAVLGDSLLIDRGNDVRITWLGAALLAGYHLWIAAGLPGVGA